MAAVGLWLVCGVAAAAPKTDVITLDNGDSITGEIKKLENGIVIFKTDHMSTVNIEWQHIREVVSTQSFEVELTDGERFYGSLAAPSAAGLLRVLGPLDTVELALGRVVFIEPIKGKFIKRLSGGLGLGFSYDKGSDVAKLTFDGSLRYRDRKRRASLTLSSTVTTQRDAPTTEREDANFTLLHFLQSKWFLEGDAGFNRNDELGIASRVSVGGGGGRRLRQTNHSLLLISAVLTANREQPTDGPSTTNAELPISTNYSVFRYDSPKTDFTMDLKLIPNLTNWGRVRVEFNLTLRKELIKDFFLSFPQLYYSYDSEPPSETANKDDYGIQTKLEWTF